MDVMQQAQKSRVDALSGKLRCLSCGRVCTSYAVLAQHLKDKHDGVNSTDLQDTPSASVAGSSESGGGFSLGDMLARKLEAASKRTPASTPSSSGGRARESLPANISGPQDIRALLKEFKSRAHFSAAMRGHIASSKNKKMSRLKRIIVRERAEKAVAVASQAASQATASAAAAKQAHADLVRDMQERAQASSFQMSNHMPGSLQTEVMKMAVAEAERRLAEADRLEAAARAALDTRLREREKLYTARVRQSDSAPNLPPGRPVAAHSIEEASKGDAVQPMLAPGSPVSGASERVEAGSSDNGSVATFGGAMGAWLDSSTHRVLGSVPEIEEDEETSDDDLGPDGWDDVLSAWMGSAGLPDVWSSAAAPSHAASTTSSQSPARHKSPMTPTVDCETSTPARGTPGKPPVGPSPGRSSLEKKPAAAATQPPAWLQDASSSDEDEPPPAVEPPVTSPQASISNQQDPCRKSLTELLDALPQQHAQPTPPIGMQNPPPGAQVSAPAPTFPQSEGHSLFHNQLLGTPVQSQNHRGTSAPAGLGFDIRELLRTQVFDPSPKPSWGQPDLGQHNSASSSNCPPMQQPHAFANGAECQHRTGSLSALPTANVGSHFEMPTGLGLRAPSLPGTAYSHAGSSSIDAGANVDELEALGQRHLSWDTATRTFQASLAGVLRGHMDASTLDGNSLGSRDSRRLLEGLMSVQADLANGGTPLAMPQSDMRMAQNLLAAQAELQNGLADMGMIHPDMGMAHSDLGMPQQAGLGMAPGNPSGLRISPGNLLGAQTLSGSCSGSSSNNDIYSGPVRSGTLPADLSGLMQTLLRSSSNHSNQQSFQQQLHAGPLARHSSIGQLPSAGSHMHPNQLPMGRSLDTYMHTAGDVRAWLRHSTAGLGSHDHGRYIGRAPDLNQQGTMQGQLDGGLETFSDSFRKTCNVCQVTCTAHENFQQHLDSRKHQRNAASAAAAEVDLRQAAAAAAAAQLGQQLPGQHSSSASPGPNLQFDPADLPGQDAGGAATYMGPEANCRTYCCQVITADLNKVVVELLQSLLYWQERARALHPAKAKQKKRLVSGLREVAKAVRSKRARVVIVAPNIEHIQTEGGLDDLLTSILSQAEELGIPVVFALSRKKLGQVFGCRKKMSAIAVLDYSSAEAMHKRMTALAAAGREDWQQHRAKGLEPPPPADDTINLEDSVSPAPDQQRASATTGLLNRDTSVEWAAQPAAASNPTDLHFSQQQQQQQALQSAAVCTNPPPQLSNHPPAAIGQQTPHFHPHPPPFDTPIGCPSSKGAQQFPLTRNPSPSPRNGDSRNGYTPGPYAIGHYPEGPTASPSFSGGANGAGRQPSASPGYRHGNQHGPDSWTGHNGSENQAFQGPPPGPVPSPSIPYAFMMPGSYPMQGMWGASGAMGSMQNVLLGQGQQDPQASAPGMAFGMPYGHVSMAYSYHPYNTPPPAMLYSQAMGPAGLNPYAMPPSPRQPPTHSRNAKLRPGAVPFQPGYWSQGMAWQ
ncbi:hypothetical protein WJX74_008862 [Apatococcus lobatus]|uniref:C2H2-type domain-containing protein n=1 Tax=Apatococcus lobatus TaxID=904363 RepID=A0AAW1PYQ0_9CHLO